MDGRSLRVRRRLGEAKTLYIPSDVITKLEELAAKTGKSFSGLVSKALRAFYEIKPRQPKRRIIRRTEDRRSAKKGS